MDLLYLSDKLEYSIKILSEFSFWNLTKYFKLDNNKIIQDFVILKIKSKEYFLFPPQYKSLELGLLNDTNQTVLVSMPTGAGKTLLGELLALNDISKNNKSFIVYVSPSRALAREKFDVFREIFPFLSKSNKICLLTGDVVIDSKTAVLNNDIVILTPEKFDMILRNKFFGKIITTLIFDEFHNMRTGFRGIRMQFDIIRSRHSFPKCKIFFISAILSPENLSEIKLWLNANFRGGVTC